MNYFRNKYPHFKNCMIYQNSSIIFNEYNKSCSNLYFHMINTVISPYLLAKNKDEVFNKWIFDYKTPGQLQRVFDLAKIIKHHQPTSSSFFANDLDFNIDLESSDCEIEYKILLECEKLDGFNFETKMW